MYSRISINILLVVAIWVYSLTMDQGHWNADTAENDFVGGKGHSNQVQDMVVVDDVVITCGMDDSVMYIDVATKQYGQVDQFHFVTFTLVF